jgi:hypothetical protein
MRCLAMSVRRRPMMQALGCMATDADRPMMHDPLDMSLSNACNPRRE